MNVIEYKKLLLAHVKDTLDDSNSGLGYNVTEFFGTKSPEALYNYIKARLNAGNGSVYCRIAKTDYDAVDTIGRAYNADFQIEIICAAVSSMREDQLPDSDRFTDEMIVKVRNELVTNPVTLDNDVKTLYIDEDISLFRDNNVDAQLIKFNVFNKYLEF